MRLIGMISSVCAMLLATEASARLPTQAESHLSELSISLPTHATIDMLVCESSELALSIYEASTVGYYYGFPFFPVTIEIGPTPLSLIPLVIQMNQLYGECIEVTVEIMLEDVNFCSHTIDVGCAQLEIMRDDEFLGYGIIFLKE